uniref:peptide ABC transporter substrate-binding protein n=1 Tax=Vaginimicrobium propionicum TaxID=1871034 RepID=UPI000971496A|nr:ABC transporter substrate-binding protein [Vaginimicrobium propionicum]
MGLKKSLLAATAVLALALSACSGAATGDNKSNTKSGEATTGIVLANGTEPQRPFIPADINETGGGRIADLLFAGLYYYDVNGEAKLELAESVESEDNITWTVKLKEGKKFADDTEVKANNFVEAWKLGAKNGMLSSNFFEPIEGASVDGTGDLTGLEVVDDHTFTIKLKQAESDFPARLGYSAFYPIADASLKTIADDPENGAATVGNNPVANGPYMFKDQSESAWEHNVQLQLVPNPNYDGDRKAMNGGINFIFYTNQDSAYTDLQAGNLDVIDQVPESAFETYEDELNGRSVNQLTTVFQSFTIPMGLKHFSGEEGQLRRQALSHAINREEITKVAFSGTRTPAKEFSSPALPGYDAKIKGNDVLTYDPEKAKELWAKADEISKFEGKFTIAYNSDGGHQTWVDATANSIKNTLGIEAEGKPYADFKSLREDVTNRTIEGAFRTGWQADYPSIYNFLAPIYMTGAGSNDADYSSPDFDALMSKAAGTADQDEAHKILNQAQEILFKDLPAIPLWYANVNGGWSEAVDNVAFDWHSMPVYYKITKEA